MLDNKIVFIFYLAAVICFALAAAGEGGRRGAMARISLVPLGLALYVFPQMWNAGVEGF